VRGNSDVEHHLHAGLLEAVLQGGELVGEFAQFAVIERRENEVVTNDESTCSVFDTTLTGTPSSWPISAKAIRIIHCGPLTPMALPQK